MTKIQARLVEDNHNLIYHVIHTMSLDIDEYYDVAAIGLCKAAVTFKPEHNVQFSTYAYRVMRTEILRDKLDHKRVKRGKGEEPIYYDMIIDEHNNITLLDTIESKECPIDEVVVGNMMLDAIFSQLNHTGKRVLSLMMMGYTQKDVARMAGCSQQNVSLIKKNIKKMILE